MKKIIALLLVITCLSLNSALAGNEIKVIDEEFEIRSGIRYGMTIAEAKAIEDTNGKKCDDLEFSAGLVSYSGISIAGIPNSDLHFSGNGFDNNKWLSCILEGISPLEYVEDYIYSAQLRMIHYDFGGVKTADQAKTIFETMNESLTAKYGTPFTTSIDKRLSIESAAPILDNFKHSDWRSKNQIIDFSEWLVAYKDCYVLISEIAYDSYDYATCNLIYRFVSYEEMDSIITENQRFMNQMESEMTSDL